MSRICEETRICNALEMKNVFSTHWREKRLCNALATKLLVATHWRRKNHMNRTCHEKRGRNGKYIFNPFEKKTTFVAHSRRKLIWGENFSETYSWRKRHLRRCISDKTYVCYEKRIWKEKTKNSFTTHLQRTFSFATHMWRKTYLQLIGE